MAEEGNRRKNITGDDVKQTLNDLASWFKSNAPDVSARLEASAGKVSEADVKGKGAEFESTFLDICLGKFNGGMKYLDTYAGLSPAEIEQVTADHNLQSLGLIPFARDIDGSLQCIKVDGNTVVSWEPEDKIFSEDLKMNLKKSCNYICNLKAWILDSVFSA